MKAIFYETRPVGWITCKWLRCFWRGCLTTSLNGISLRQVRKPELPGNDWVRVRTRLGGICGTDLAIVAQKQPPNSILQGFSSTPMGLGHENVAEVETVGAEVDHRWVGRRVLVEPTLCCQVRRIEPPCPRCAAGEFGACEYFGASPEVAGMLPPGTSIGYNAATGGSFGEYFIAHQSQLVPLDDSISDEQAILVDPLACSLHAILRADLREVRRVLVYGAGVLGLGAIAVLRAMGYPGEIHALDRAPYLEKLAASLGADKFVRLPNDPGGRFERIAELTGGRVTRVRFGNYMLSGGYDLILDCVGSAASLNESMKWTRSRGQVVMVGTGHGGRIDLTPLWFTELTLLGAYGRQLEPYQGRRVGTYPLVLELLASGKLKTDGLLTHLFPLEQYRRALEVGLYKGRYNAVKVALDFRLAADR